MADESLYLLVFWTLLVGLLVLFYYWKRSTTITSSSTSKVTRETTSSVKEARLRRFEFAESTPDSEAGETENVQNETTEEVSQKRSSACRNRNFKHNRKDKSRKLTEKVILGPNSTYFSDRTVAASHFDPDTGSPITLPLKTLEEVMCWSRGFDEFNVATVTLPVEYTGRSDKPQTLVCHDMKGGYIEDRFVQGYNSAQCYYIYHWQYIDVFVYFSHHFVTIPPPCWTNAAHTNGVPVLGTFITEWEDGAKRCSQFLEDSRSYKALANQLVDMADYYNFDGWIINIENPIQPAQVNSLVEFVDYLTKAMHACHPHSLVIWYDSVTYKGDLKWQNELNSNNSLFFESCDGLFLNYTWSIQQLSLSARAARAYGRLISEVYVGVDVFGRDCYSGGGYKCNEAFRVIRDEKLSAALFAPGWVMETQGVKNFTTNQNKFWNLLSKYCPTHPVAVNIPFVTSMCRGNGEKVFIDGQVVYSNPWTNLSCQQVQLSYSNAFYNMGGKGGILISEVRHTLGDAYNGGGCQLVHGRTSDTQETARSVIRLFEAAVTLSSGILVSLTFKLTPADCFQVSLQLHTDRKPTYILLCPSPASEQDFSKSDNTKLSKTFKKKYGIHKSRMIMSSEFMAPIGQEHYEAYAPLTGSDLDTVKTALGVMSSNEDEGAWCTRHYLIAGRQLVGCHLKEIRVVCVKTASQPKQGLAGAPFHLHIGEIKILDPKVLTWSIPTVSNLRQRDVQWKSADHKHLLNLTLMWDCPITAEMEQVAYYDVFAVWPVVSQSHEFVGRAFVEAYRICMLPVPKERTSVEFIVQAVTSSRLKKPLDQCSRINFSWN